MEEATQRFSQRCSSQRDNSCTVSPRRERVDVCLSTCMLLPVSPPPQSIHHPVSQSFTPHTHQAGQAPLPHLRPFKKNCQHSSIESTPSTLPPRPLTQKYPFPLSLLSPPLSAPSCPQMAFFPGLRLRWPPHSTPSTSASVFEFLNIFAYFLSYR